jgi:hypothetical protein
MGAGSLVLKRWPKLAVWVAWVVEMDLDSYLTFLEITY